MRLVGVPCTHASPPAGFTPLPAQTARLSCCWDSSRWLPRDARENAWLMVACTRPGTYVENVQCSLGVHRCSDLACLVRRVTCGRPTVQSASQRLVLGFWWDQVLGFWSARCSVTGWSLRCCGLCDGFVSAMAWSLRWCGLCDGVVSGVLGSMMWHKLW